MTGVRFLAADWDADSQVIAGTTFRNGGVSTGAYRGLNLGAHVGDRPAAVRANRQAFADGLELPAEPAWLRQVHGCRVAEAPFAAEEPEADACITRDPDVVCAVLTADCLPVLFATADGRAVGAAHAGWRGLHSGVLEATVAAFECDPRTLKAWFGPAISQPSFEVGAEVREAFLARTPRAAAYFAANAAGRWQADLYGLARLALDQAGVTAVHGGGRCTFAESAAFFSHRRDGRCGRMASVIWRRAT